MEAGGRQDWLPFLPPLELNRVGDSAKQTKVPGAGDIICRKVPESNPEWAMT